MAEKLIRDRIPEIALLKGDVLSVRVADLGEMLPLLLRKLAEETAEFAKDPSYAELVDIFEVVYGLAGYLAVRDRGIEGVLTTEDYVEEMISGRTKLHDMRHMKAQKSGGFHKRLVLTGISDD